MAGPRRGAVLALLLMRRIALSFCVCLVASGCVRTADLPPSNQPEEWRILAWTDQNSSSRCIGRPLTPLCAVETLLACFQRGRIELCRLVDDDTDAYASVFASPADPQAVLAYRIVVTRRIEESVAGQGRRGDVLIGLDQHETAATAPAPPAGPAATFLLRQAPDGGWKVVGWGDTDD